MYEIIHLEDESKKREIERVHGKFNDMPLNFRQITEEEFAQSHFFTYHAQVIELRQILFKDVKIIRIVTYFNIVYKVFKITINKVFIILFSN